MEHHKQPTQQGNVLSFIIIGVVALSMLALGVYSVRQLDWGANDEPIVAEIQDDEQTEDETGAGGPDEAPAQEDEQAPEEGADASPDDQVPAESDPESGVDESTASEPEASSSEEAIPDTGPNETIAMSMLLAGAVAYSGVMYAQSKRRN